MSDKYIDPKAKHALNQMKLEIAKELSNKNNILTPGANVVVGGYVGGRMTRKLVEMAEKQLIDKYDSEK